MGEPLKPTGIAASEGAAVGPAFVHAPGEPRPECENIPEDAVEELGRFRAAVEAVVRSLTKVAEELRASESGGEGLAAGCDGGLRGEPRLTRPQPLP